MKHFITITMIALCACLAFTGCGKKETYDEQVKKAEVIFKNNAREILNEYNAKRPKFTDPFPSGKGADKDPQKYQKKVAEWSARAEAFNAKQIQPKEYIFQELDKNSDWKKLPQEIKEFTWNQYKPCEW